MKRGNKLANLTRNVVSNIDLLVVQKHAVHSLNGVVGSFVCLVMNETVSLGATMFICGYLAGQNIAKSGKSIV
jgi:hypothetical protein